MREGPPSNSSTADPKRGSQSEAKSLFRNILAVSPSGSRFYPDPSIPSTHKPLRMNILADQKKKYWISIRSPHAFGAGPSGIGPSPHFSQRTREMGHPGPFFISLRGFGPFLLSAVKHGLAVFWHDPALLHQVIHRSLIPRQVVFAIRVAFRDGLAGVACLLTFRSILWEWEI